MAMPTIETYLRDHDVSYRTLAHPPAATAQETAANAHIRGRDMAKTVLVKIDGQLAMAVCSANERIDLERIRQLTGTRQVALATEMEFKDRFPECEVGAMPPFGKLYGMEMFVSNSLAEDEEIAFNAGNHNELIWLHWADFERLERPRVSMMTHH